MQLNKVLFYQLYGGRLSEKGKPSGDGLAQFVAATPSNCSDLPFEAVGTVPWSKGAGGHRGESRGCGENPTDRDNEQPSPKGFFPCRKDKTLRMQFTD